MMFVSSESYPTLAKKPKASQDFLARIGNPSIPHDHEVAHCLMGACCVLIDSGQTMTPNGKMEADQYIAALRSLNPNLPQKLEQEARDGSLQQRIATVLEGLVAESAAWANTGIKAPEVRAEYIRRIEEMSDEYMRAAIGEAARSSSLEHKVHAWKRYADEASEMRGVKLTEARAQDTLIGASMAKAMKPENMSFSDLQMDKAQKLYQKEFHQLSERQATRVWQETIDTAGKSNPDVNKLMRKAGRLGKGVALLGVAAAIANIIMAEDKLRETGKQVTIAGAGYAGGAVLAVGAVALGFSLPLVIFVTVAGSLAASLGAEYGFDAVF